MKTTLHLSFLRISLPFFFTLIFSSPAKAGDFYDLLQDRSNVGLVVRNDFLQNDHTFKTYGLRFQYELDDHWYLNYDYHFVNTDGVHLSHLPVCAMGVKYLLMYSSGDTRGLGYLAAMMMVVPEGVTYKINPQSKIQFMPYLNPLGLDRTVYDHEGMVAKGPWEFSCNTGLQVESNLPYDFYAAADIGVTIPYVATGKTIVGAGITIGMKR